MRKQADNEVEVTLATHGCFSRPTIIVFSLGLVARMFLELNRKYLINLQNTSILCIIIIL